MVRAQYLKRRHTLRNKILFLISEDWYFWSHRLPLAKAAIEKGWDVCIATRVSNLEQKMRDEGFKVISLNHFRRQTQSPWLEFLSLLEIINIYKQEKPDIVHQVALKPVVYGSLAARLTQINYIVNALAGLGFLFTSNSKLIGLAKNVVMILLRLLLSANNMHLIVQNEEDLGVVLSAGIASKEHTTIIRGSGVDIDNFTAQPEPQGLPVIMLPSRLLWDKGVKEFVEAARRLNADHRIARFVLVGIPDPENPTSIPIDDLHKWQNEGLIEWWGHQSDMPTVLAKSTIVCLPSYREGLPKVLLEAAAVGRPIVATDITGCQQIVDHGKNGLLVPPKNVQLLAEAIEKLVNDPALRKLMGAFGRKKVVSEFSDKKVVEETFAIYRAMLGDN